MTLLHLAPSTSVLHLAPVVAFMALFWLVVVTVAIWRRVTPEDRSPSWTRSPERDGRRSR